MAKTKLYTFYVGLYGADTRHVFKMASLTVTWMPSSNSWRTKNQRSGQVYHIVLPREAYYSSQVSSLCSLCISKDMSGAHQAMHM